MRSSAVLVLVVGVALVQLVHFSCAATRLKASDLITKHTFSARHRLPKANSQPQVPKPIVISTNLHVGDVEDATKSKSGNRRGRQYLDKDGSTVVVEGVRMPDDESDRVVWRNGRVINNVFVPNDAPRPSARQGKSADTARDYTFHAGDTKSGRPVYYVVDDEVESLHADRSPYSYEPADALTSLSSPAGLPSIQGGVSPQSSSDFVIKEHTYTMCPGCPTFSIPVPVPKASIPSPGLPTLPFSKEAVSAPKPEAGPRNDTEADNSNFLQRMSHRMVVTMKKLQSQALGLLRPLSGESKAEGDSATSASEHVASDKKDVREDSSSSSSSSVSSKPSPLAIAGMASVAMLSMSLLSTVATITRVAGRSASTSTADTLQELNCILESICKGVDQVAESERGYFSQVCSQKSRNSFDRNCRGENRRRRLLPAT